MNLKYKEGERTITINGQKIILPATIWDVKDVDGRVIIFLHPRSSSRNVLCFSDIGKLLWTIQENGYFTHPDDTWYEGMDSDGINGDGRWVVSCRGRPFYLDIETGKVTFIPGFFEK